MDKTIYGETEYLIEPFYGWNFDIINSDEIGKILHGQYRILKVLGKGNKSKVLLAEDLRTEKKICIKLMLKNELEEFLANEYKILKNLSHEGIIKVFEYKEENSIEPPCLVMEYFEGKSLKEFFYEDNLAQINILEIFLRLAYSLKYLHDNLFLHWDIKPENILTSKNGEVKIIDFGISFKSYEKDRGLGTIKYMSPERILGEEVDVRSEIYSYFISLYEGITGEYPFVGGDLKKRIVHEKIKDFANSDILVKRFLQRGLEKELHLRYDDFDEVIKDLKDLIFFKKEIIPFLDKNNRGSLTNHVLLNNKNRNTCDFYFDMLYMEMGYKSQIENDYARIKPFLLDYLRSIFYNIEDKFSYVDFFNSLEKVFNNLEYEKIEKYIKTEIEDFLDKKEKNLKQINDRGDLAFNNNDYPLAIKEFKRSSLQGSSYGYYKLGEMYEKGLGLPVNLEKSFENFITCKKMNYLPAIKKLGEYYYLGTGIEKNYDEAFRLFKVASEKGDAVSQRFLGECYKLGLGVTVDYEEAYKWFKSSFDSGDLYSARGLGELFERGLGVSKDLEKAIFFYETASGLNDSYSTFALATLYDSKKDFNKANKYFEKSAYSGNDQSQYQFGLYNYLGLVSEKDENKALFWIEKAAEKDNLDSLNFLGKFYEERDRDKALMYFQRALSFHDKEANFNMGNFYLNSDFEKAKKYFTRSFEFGKIEAFYQLGKVYTDENFKEKNIKEAKKYLEKAADLGNLESKLLLGKLYLDNESGIKNYSKAFLLIRELSIIGNKEAMIILSSLYENGFGINKNLEEAEKWKNKAQENEVVEEKSNIFGKFKKLFNR